MGGGGKTALIHKLMEEYCVQGPVLCTTTTRVHPPDPVEGLAVISSDQLSILKMLIERVGRTFPDRPYKLVATRHFLRPNLLRGVPPDFNNELNRELFQIFLNEADGAASYSIKAPRDGEPVLMNKAEYLVPVIGIDCLYKPAREALFRWQISSERFGIHAEDLITPELAATILMHRQGVCKDWEDRMSIIPFINKVDDAEQEASARNLALLILHNSNFPIKHVVFGSVLRGRADSISV